MPELADGKEVSLDPWGLTSDDSLLAPRDIGTQEIYALYWEAP